MSNSSLGHKEQKNQLREIHTMVVLETEVKITKGH